MIGGALLLKHAMDSEAAWAEVVGLLVAAGGAVTLLWSARRYEALHRLLRNGSDVTHPAMLKAVTWATMTLAAGAVLLIAITRLN
jgi:hypothetical protein